MPRTQRPATTQRQSIQSVNQTNNRFAIEVKTQSKMPKHLGHIPNALSLSLSLLPLRATYAQPTQRKSDSPAVGQKGLNADNSTNLEQQSAH